MHWFNLGRFFLSSELKNKKEKIRKFYQTFFSTDWNFYIIEKPQVKPFLEYHRKWKWTFKRQTQIWIMKQLLVVNISEMNKQDVGWCKKSSLHFSVGLLTRLEIEAPVFYYAFCGCFQSRLMGFFTSLARIVFSEWFSGVVCLFSGVSCQPADSPI